LQPPWLAVSCAFLIVLVVGCGGGSDPPVATPTNRPLARSTPAPTGVISYSIGTRGVPSYVPPTPSPTATPLPTPVPLPGENCPPLDLSRDEPGVYVFDVTTCVLGRFNTAPSDDSVTWSPDGSKLAFVRFTAPSTEARSNLFVLDLQTGAETQVSFAPDERKHTLTWSPDGSKLAFYMRSYTGEGPTQNFGLWILDLATSSQKLLLPDSEHGYCLYGWSPDSNSIAAGCTHGSLHLIDVASGERRVLDEHHGFGDPAWSPSGQMIAYSCETAPGGGYFTCAIRRDGSGRVMFPDRGQGAIWDFAGDKVVFSGGGSLFFGDPATGTYTHVIGGWAGGEPRFFLSERVLSGFMCSPNVQPCIGHRMLTDIDAGMTIEAILGPGAEWSPNKRYIAFAIGDTGVAAL
jgi:WD40-like Beta Propeller Repeat